MIRNFFAGVFIAFSIFLVWAFVWLTMPWLAAMSDYSGKMAREYFGVK